MAATKFSSAFASKYRGSMIGGLMGDCLGAPFEADSHVSETVLSNYITKLLYKESIQILPYTDDTCMTLSVASSLIKKGQVDAKDMAERFVTEYFSQPKRGYGMNVVEVFKVLRETNYEDVFLPAKLQFNGTGSYGNGAAMRIAPIALFGHSKGEDFIITAAEECSRITHTHKNGYNGAILQCLAVNAALGLDSSKEFDSVNFVENLLAKMETIELKQDKKPYCESLNNIKEICVKKNLGNLKAAHIADLLGNDVSAHRSVPSAIYSFLRGMHDLKDYDNSNPFLRTLYFAISLGGDTDTIASMAGSIAGAYYSAEIIPEVLQKRCELIDVVIKLADKLFEASQNSS